jgi:hypothetical protein
MKNNEEGGFILPLYLGYKTFKTLVPTYMDYTKEDKMYLEKYGAWKIKEMRIIRTPLNNLLKGTLNTISLGKLEEAMRKYGYDKLFHLALICELQNPNNEHQTRSCLIEKNEVVRIRDEKASDLSNKTDVLKVPDVGGKNLTLKDFLDLGLTDMGSGQFFNYSPFENNCQDFLINLLGASGLLSSGLKSFIKQDLKTIGRHINSLNPLTTTVSKEITDLASRFQTLRNLI